MNSREKFVSGMKSFGLDITDTQLEQFDKYYELLVEWNKKFNLTSITEYDEVLLKHFLDSVSIVKTDILCKPMSIIDIGTGAGFPGIPIKIMFPDTKVVLLDSLQKRVTFLNEVISSLSLDDITAIHGRAEDFGKDKLYREQFDICVSRAVANLSSLSEFCIPFVKKNGYFISYKSEKASEELQVANHAIDVLGGGNIETICFDIEGNNRTLIKIEKIKNTPSQYPRKAGTPIKKPL